MKKVIQFAKSLTMATAVAVLAACGGGGGSSDTMPPRTQLDIAGFKLGSYSYSQDASRKGVINVSVAGGLDIFESTIPSNVPAGATANAFAGFGAILTLPDDIKAGFAAAQAIEVNLSAIANPSAGATRTIKVQLKKPGTDTSGCLPTAEVQVPESLTKFVLALTAAQFPLPSFCTGPTASNPAFAGVVVDIEAIQIEDGNIAATAVVSKISIGKVAFAAAPPILPPPPPPPPSASGVLVASFSTAAGTAATVQGSIIDGGFSYSGTDDANGNSPPTALTPPTKSIVNNSLLQWSSSITEGIGGYAGSAAQIRIPASLANWSTATSVSLQVASDQTNQFRVVVRGDATTGNCQYLKEMTTGSVSNTLSTVTLALSEFTRDEFGCNSVAGVTPTLAQVLANVFEIRVIDTNWSYNATAPRTSSNQVGDIRVAPGALSVAAPAVTFTDWANANSGFTQYLDVNYSSQNLSSTNIATSAAGTTFTHANANDQGMRAFFQNGTANLAGKNRIKIVGLSASEATQVRIYIQFTGYSYNDCTPFYFINGVTTTPQDFEVDLTMPITNQQRIDNFIGCQTNTVTPNDVLGTVTDFILEARQRGTPGAAPAVPFNTLRVQKLQVNN